MNTRLYQIVALVSLVLFPWAYSLQAQMQQAQAPAHNHDMENGKQLYATCIACHGVNGEGNVQLKAPRIGGQYEWYTRSQLTKFKSGQRGTHPSDTTGALMVPAAQALQSDKDIHDLAAYTATLKSPVPMATIQGNAVRGKVLFMACVACHGGAGQGLVNMQGPSLILLNDWYIQSQLVKFRHGIRGGATDNLSGKQMQAMAAIIKNDQELKDVIAYITAIARKIR